LRADLPALARELGPPVVALGNLPYSIAGRLLGELLVPSSPFRRLAFMLQLEVAQRLLASPGGREWGPLAIFSRLWCPGRLALELGPGEFEPRPRVRSAFVVLDPAAGRADASGAVALRRLVRTAFQHRRKTLRGALRGRVAGADAACEALGIDPGRRPETLSELEFAALARALEEREQA
jgi:16S rRNA (adenine1518-N6/adenine1519-N6)-dimethyltransferase